MKPLTHFKWRLKMQKLYKKFQPKVHLRFTRDKKDFRGKLIVIVIEKFKTFGLVCKTSKDPRATALQLLGVMHNSSPCYRTTSRKFIIKPKRDKQKFHQLQKLKFLTPKDFQMKFFKLWKFHEEKLRQNLEKRKTENTKKLTPITIYKCKELNCKEKFTKSNALQHHIENDHKSKVPQSEDNSENTKNPLLEEIVKTAGLEIVSEAQLINEDPILILDSDDEEDNIDDSEGRLLIDDDVEFVLEENAITIPSHNVIPLVKNEKKENEAIQVLKKTLLCEFCDEEFSRQSSLIAHVKLSHHKNTKVSKKCEKKSNGLTGSENGNVLYFKRYDTNKDTFICRICSSKYKQRAHLDRHFVTLHVSKVFICTKCEIEFTGRVEMHLNSHHGSELSGHDYIQELEKIQTNRFCFNCPICSFKSKDRGRVEEHLTNEHYEEFEKESLNENENTSQPTTSTQDLLHTLFEPDSMQKIIDLTEKLKTSNSFLKHRCFRCQERFQTRDDLKDHECLAQITSSQNNNIIKQTRPSLNGFYSCKCLKYFTNKELYESHCRETHS